MAEITTIPFVRGEHNTLRELVRKYLTDIGLFRPPPGDWNLWAPNALEQTYERNYISHPASEVPIRRMIHTFNACQDMPIIQIDDRNLTVTMERASEHVSAHAAACLRQGKSDVLMHLGWLVVVPNKPAPDNLVGHSCLLHLDLRTRTQTFFDPNGGGGGSGSNRFDIMAKRNLAPNFISTVVSQNGNVEGWMLTNIAQHTAVHERFAAPPTDARLRFSVQEALERRMGEPSYYLPGMCNFVANLLYCLCHRFQYFKLRYIAAIVKEIMDDVPDAGTPNTVHMDRVRFNLFDWQRRLSCRLEVGKLYTLLGLMLPGPTRCGVYAQGRGFCDAQGEPGEALCLVHRQTVLGFHGHIRGNLPGQVSYVDRTPAVNNRIPRVIPADAVPIPVLETNQTLNSHIWERNTAGKRLILRYRPGSTTVCSDFGALDNQANNWIVLDVQGYTGPLQQYIWLHVWESMWWLIQAMDRKMPYLLACVDSISTDSLAFLMEQVDIGYPAFTHAYVYSVDRDSLIGIRAPNLRPPFNEHPMRVPLDCAHAKLQYDPKAPPLPFIDWRYLEYMHLDDLTEPYDIVETLMKQPVNPDSDEFPDVKRRRVAPRRWLLCTFKAHIPHNVSVSLSNLIEWLLHVRVSPLMTCGVNSGAYLLVDGGDLETEKHPSTMVCVGREPWDKWQHTFVDDIWPSFFRLEFCGCPTAAQWNILLANLQYGLEDNDWVWVRPHPTFLQGTVFTYLPIEDGKRLRGLRLVLTQPEEIAVLDTAHQHAQIPCDELVLEVHSCPKPVPQLVKRLLCDIDFNCLRLRLRFVRYNGGNLTSTVSLADCKSTIPVSVELHAGRDLTDYLQCPDNVEVHWTSEA